VNDSSIIRAEHVSKRFGKDTQALDDVSISIDAGTIYGLLGPNGAGKTTLIRVLATLLKPDAGSAWIAGINVIDDPVTTRTKIGLGGQYAAIDEFLTGRENVEMIGRLYNLLPDVAKENTEEVLAQIRLDDAADRQVGTYSGGMRRRLDLAASLVGKPDVLFLDEPTTGIDPRSRVDIWDLIRDLVSGGTTLLMTTQYLEEADYLADRIGVIDHGRLIEEGTADELKDRIGGTVVEVALPVERRAEAAALLTAISGDEPQLDTNRGVLVIQAPDGSRTLIDVVRRLDEAGIQPNDIEMHKPTLDDVFLTLTGHVAAPSAPNGNGAVTEGTSPADTGPRPPFRRRRR